MAATPGEPGPKGRGLDRDRTDHDLGTGGAHLDTPTEVTTEVTETPKSASSPEVSSHPDASLSLFPRRVLRACKSSISLGSSLLSSRAIFFFATLFLARGEGKTKRNPPQDVRRSESGKAHPSSFLPLSLSLSLNIIYFPFVSRQCVRDRAHKKGFPFSEGSIRMVLGYEFPCLTHPYPASSSLEILLKCAQ